MKIATVLILSVMLFMGGCSSTMTTITKSPDGSEVTTSQPGSVFGPSSYDMGYRDMYVAHEQSKQDRADSILSQPSPADPVAKAYSDTNKILAVALLSMEKFDVKAPVTGFDVLYKLTDSVVPVAGFGALWQLGKVGIENAGSIINGGATNSLNHVNSTALATGTNTSANPTATGTSPAQVVTTEKVVPAQVVYPEIVKVP